MLSMCIIVVKCVEEYETVACSPLMQNASAMQHQSSLMASLLIEREANVAALMTTLRSFVQWMGFNYYLYSSKYFLLELKLLSLTRCELDVFTLQHFHKGPFKNMSRLKGEGIRQSVTSVTGVGGECCIAWCHTCGIFLICKLSFTLLTHTMDELN